MQVSESVLCSSNIPHIRWSYVNPCSLWIHGPHTPWKKRAFSTYEHVTRWSQVDLSPTLSEPTSTVFGETLRAVYFTHSTAEWFWTWNDLTFKLGRMVPLWSDVQQAVTHRRTEASWRKALTDYHNTTDKRLILDMRLVNTPLHPWLTRT